MTLSVLLWRNIGSSLQRCFSSLRFAGIHLCTALLRSAAAFQLAWGLDSDWPIATLWFFSLSACCVFVAVLCIVFLFHDPFLAQAAGKMLERLPLHHCTWQLVWCVGADFGFHQTLHYGQTCSLWSCLAKGHGSRSLAICSGAVLLTWSVCCNSCFKEKGLSPGNPSKLTALAQFDPGAN